MKRITRVVVTATLGICMSMITSAALASPPQGQGNGGNSANAPGHEKPAAPAAAPTGHGKAVGKSKSSASSHQTANSSPTTAGMKPANNTAKGTHCSTGGSPGAATCTVTGSNTAQATAKTDASKRYGNGQTAAQIAVGRGAPTGTELYGPGNSQPHKVTDCKHKHGVDVHAVKSYSSAGCTPPTPPPTESKQPSGCPPASITTVVTGVWHHTGSKTKPFVLIHPNAHSAHMSKHSDDQVATQIVTQTAPGQSCSSNSTTTSSNNNTSVVTQQQSSVAANQARSATSGTQGVVTAKGSKSSGKLAAGEAREQKRSGGVLGASARVSRALGAVAHRGSLPFTGFPIWAAVLIGLGLIGGGLMLRHRGSTIV